MGCFRGGRDPPSPSPPTCLLLHTELLYIDHNSLVVLSIITQQWCSLMKLCYSHILCVWACMHARVCVCLLYLVITHLTRHQSSGIPSNFSPSPPLAFFPSALSFTSPLSSRPPTFFFPHRKKQMMSFQLFTCWRFPLLIINSYIIRSPLLRGLSLEQHDTLKRHCHHLLSFLLHLFFCKTTPSSFSLSYFSSSAF